LVEVLVVLIVIGILVALILPNTIKAIDRANLAADDANVDTLQTAVFLCYTDLRVWSSCDTQAKLVGTNGDYLDALITSPFAPTYGYTFTNVVDNGVVIGIRVSSTHP